MQSNKGSSLFLIVVRLLMLIAYSIGCIFFGLMAWEEWAEAKAYVVPQYEKIDIIGILNSDSLSELDYRTLFEQTGLGKVAIDDLMQMEAGIATISRHHDNFFSPVKVNCESIFITTRAETIVNEDGEVTKGFELAPIKDGYVLITKSTHFFGWRHGHAALVVDAKTGTTLEAAIVGENSSYQNVEGWRTYPSFVMLKLKEGNDELMKQIVEFAKSELYDVPYSMTVGILNDKFGESGEINGTQCAHLIWNSFYKFGFDIDYDGGGLVTPKDIINSPLFEIVQVYGMDVYEPWE